MFGLYFGYTQVDEPTGALISAGRCGAAGSTIDCFALTALDEDPLEAGAGVFSPLSVPSGGYSAYWFVKVPEPSNAILTSVGTVLLAFIGRREGKNRWRLHYGTNRTIWRDLLMTFAGGPLMAVAAAAAPPPIDGFELLCGCRHDDSGLVGSYVDQDLRSDLTQSDWRASQSVSGTRIDAVDFRSSVDWGARASVGITGGPNDQNWDFFSVQWDGYIRVTIPGTRIATRSDDGSRMWIDADRDGTFSPSAPELVDNNWGGLQAATLSELSPQLAAGLYRIRIQYAEHEFGASMELEGIVPTIRFAYVVPSNRSPQSNAITNLERHVMPDLHRWYCDQMDRNGVGRIAPNFERNANGDFVAHLLNVAETDEEIRVDLLGQTLAAAANAGFEIREGEVWMMIPEAHWLMPDGTLQGVTSLGGGHGQRTTSAGISITESVLLSKMNRIGFLDDQPYGGRIIPEIGEYPLVQGVTFAPWGGSTISSNVSNIYGALGHELTHGLAIDHDGRNEMAIGSSAHGNMMGLGFPHFRGAAFPELFPDQHMRLTWADSQVLALSEYFRPCDGSAPPLDDDVLALDDSPVVTIQTSGNVAPSDGHLAVAGSASDPDGLAMARLIWGGGYVADLPLSGTSSSFEMRDTLLHKGGTNHFTVVVYDQRGNHGRSNVSLDVNPNKNQAPRASLIANPAQAAPGAPVELRALPGTTDDSTPASSLMFEWFLDDAGSPVSTGEAKGALSTFFSTEGDHFARSSRNGCERRLEHVVADRDSRRPCVLGWSRQRCSARLGFRRRGEHRWPRRDRSERCRSGMRFRRGPRRDARTYAGLFAGHFIDLDGAGRQTSAFGVEPSRITRIKTWMTRRSCRNSRDLNAPRGSLRKASGEAESYRADSCSRPPGDRTAQPSILRTVFSQNRDRLEGDRHGETRRNAIPSIREMEIERFSPVNDSVLSALADPSRIGPVVISRGSA
ncbi:MAG: hypothetical protein IPK00_10310 [Deltaproteobacteria bacterium]|nr:hypothetical protein [Deltaproteobacteria bacterium]